MSGRDKAPGGAPDPVRAASASADPPDPATVIARSPLFDREWYLAHTPSARRSGFDPASHYLQVGACMGRDPGPDFDTRAYLSAHPEVAKAGLNPLLHFEMHGRPAGQQPPEPAGAPTRFKHAKAASAMSPRGWTMTRREAEEVMATALAPWSGAAEPRRVLTVFDTLSARRYVAAAALYASESAALKATVVMATYNRGARIEAAVRSVLAQSHANLELLVVDDGSTDDTSARLARFADDPRVRVFRNTHGGVSAARNTGLAHATGDYVFYLDSDNTWTPDHLKLMLAGLHATGAECAYAASCLVGRTGAPAGYRGEPFDWDACLARNYVDLNVFAHRTGLTRELGGFDTDLRRVVDWDLILRYTKGRAVAFLPFVGCRYLDDARDRTRITNAQPRLYRRMVIEKNRRGLGSGAEALAAMSLSFGIKIAAPFGQREEWGDYHFADSLARALTRRGHSARIDYKGKWAAAETRYDDVALVLRGVERFKPRRGQVTLAWVISHPDRVSYDEYAGCDRVMVASRSYAALLSMILERPVEPVLQCTDAERFHLPEGAPPPDAEARGLFVGNSRNEYRRIVRWAVENDLDLDIYGTRWDQFIPGRVAGENVSNAELGESYRSARFVLNDHWQSMKEFGFVSNRVFDVVASGGRLISDRVPSIESMFGDAVATVDDEAALLEAAAHPPPSPERRRAAARYVAAHHTFDARAGSIQAAVLSAVTPKGTAVPAAPDFAPSATRRRVGLLAERGPAGWSRSAFLRLIGPLTTDHAHAIAGLDLVALDGPGDPRLEGCDVCIVQGAAVGGPDAARRLVETLRARAVPLYVDVDEASGIEDGGLLMAAAREVWFSTPALADRHADAAAGKARVRRTDLDPRLWRDYRNPVGTAFDDAGPVRFVHMDAFADRSDLVPVLPAFERLARDHPGQVQLTVIGGCATLPEADWLHVLDLPGKAEGYPAFARYAARELSFDVGLAPLAPLAPAPFDAVRSDLTFLHYSAMGLLSVVSDGPAYRGCIEAGLAVGCGPTEQAWHDALAGIVERRERFTAMRQRAADHLWRERSVVADPQPLADLLAAPGRHA